MCGIRIVLTKNYHFFTNSTITRESIIKDEFVKFDFDLKDSSNYSYRVFCNDFFFIVPFSFSSKLLLEIGNPNQELSRVTDISVEIRE